MPTQKPSFLFSALMQAVAVPDQQVIADLEQQAIAVPELLGMKKSVLPHWSQDNTARNAALMEVEPNIDKKEHLLRAVSAADELRQSRAYRRAFAKRAHRQIWHRSAAWGDMHWHRVSSGESFDGKLHHYCDIELRPRAIADDPRLLIDIFCNGMNYAVDMPFTQWVLNRLEKYNGPGYIYASEGRSFSHGCVIHCSIPADECDWNAVGRALAALLDERFDRAASAVLKQLAREHRYQARR